MYKSNIKQLSVFFILFSLCFLTACESYPVENASSKADFPVVIENITLYGEPERIVSLSDEITSALAALGLTDRIAGVNTDSALEDYAETLVAGTAEQPDIQAILELEPDLVITDTALSTKNIQALSSQRIKVLVLSGEAEQYLAVLEKLKASDSE